MQDSSNATLLARSIVINKRDTILSDCKQSFITKADRILDSFAERRTLIQELD